MIRRIAGPVSVAVAVVLWLLSGQMAVCFVQPQVPLAEETIENIARVLWIKDIYPANPPGFTYRCQTGPTAWPEAFDDELIRRLEKPVNSPAAFGERMRRRLDDLIAEPDSWTPDYSPRYEKLKRYATSLSPHQAYAYNIMLGPSSSRGYQTLPSQPPDFRFPYDDRIQCEYQVEWHFFVGSVFDATGLEYGVQLMFWRYTLLPPDLARELGLSETENQVVEMHFAISRAGDRHYRAKPYIIAGTTGLLQFSSGPFDYRVGNNSIRSSGADSLFPIRLRAWGLDESQARPVEIEIDLTLDQAKGYVLNGDQGLAPSCGGVGTLYYSVTNLSLDATKSTLRVGGSTVSLTNGKMWYDHQWGTGFMPGGNARSDVIRAATNLAPGQPNGWEWISIQLDDDTEIALSAVHSTDNLAFYHQTGPNQPGVMTADAVGSYIRRDGSYEQATATIQVTEWVKSKVAYGLYLATDLWYPNRVEIALDGQAVPQEKRRLTLVPIVSTGQQGFFANGAQYSEGAVYVRTPDGQNVGRGFLESTGYGDMSRQILLLGGVPQTEEMIQSLIPPVLSPEERAQCEAWLMIPTNAARLVQELAECRGL